MTIKLSDFLTSLKIALEQLWLSVSSIKFYQDVYNKYNGYGIKYIIYISFFACLFYSFLILTYLVNLKESFTSSTPSIVTANLEHLIKQLPPINYDGTNIAIQEETPIYLKDINERKIAAFDPNNQLSYAEKAKIPLVFTKNALVFKQKNGELKTVAYSSSWLAKSGKFEPYTITQEDIKKTITNIFNSAPRFLIYAGLPTMIILCLVSMLIEKIFMVTLIYFFTLLLNVQTSIKTCTRLVLFASGVQALIQPIIIMPMIVLLPEASTLWFISMVWPDILLFAAILKLRRSG